MPHVELQQTILALYRGCREQSAHEFKRWAMETVRMTVAFDSGIWGTPDVVSDEFSSIFVFRQPPEMMANYARNVRLSGDPLGQAALAQPQRTVMINNLPSWPPFANYPEVTEHVRRFGITHALATYHVSPVTRISTGIAFYRADPGSPFSETDRQATELLVPHLIEALRINLFSFLHDPHPEGIDPAGALAICDPIGTLYETTAQFSNLLHHIWPEWGGHHVPLPFERLHGQGANWSHAGLNFSSRPCRDLFLVVATPATELDKLSRRQREVAELMVAGKTYKDIAKELAITQSTVTNHVNQIHERLQIRGREELIALFNATKPS